jgi:hypothetical protein
MITEAPPVLGDIGAITKYVCLFDWKWAHVAGGYWGLELGVREER